MKFFLNELKVVLISKYRYKFELISSWLLYILIFGVLIKTAKGYVNSIPKEGAEIIISYALWMLVLSVTTQFASQIQSSAEEGTLEQIFITPVNPFMILIFREIADFLVQFIGFVIVILVLANISNLKLFLNPIGFIPFVITIVGSMGIGFISGSVALFTKKSYGINLIIQFYLLVVSVIPTSIYDKIRIIKYLLPYSGGVEIMRKCFLEELRFNSFILDLNLWIFFLNSIFYFLIGLCMFNNTIKIAKQKGLLAGY